MSGSTRNTVARVITPLILPFLFYKIPLPFRRSLKFRLGLTAANFWSDGTQSTGPITVNRKAAVLLQLTETNLAVAVAWTPRTPTPPE